MEYEGDWEVARRFEWAPSLAGVCNLLLCCRRFFSRVQEGLLFMKEDGKKELALDINGERYSPMQAFRKSRNDRIGIQAEMIPMSLVFSTVGILIRDETAPVAISKSDSFSTVIPDFDSIRIDVRNERSRRVVFRFHRWTP